LRSVASLYDARMRVSEALLVERERELEALERVLERLGEGTAGPRSWRGQRGIGKTRLLSAIALSGDALLLRARASELERDYPFGVVRRLFEPLLLGATEVERQWLLAGAGGLAECVLVASAADDGGADVYASLQGLYRFAGNLAALRPALLLVDDAQWSDAASLRWLAVVLHRLDGVPLALLLAVRTGEISGEQALLDELVSGKLAELEAHARAALDLSSPYGVPLAAVDLADALVERGDAEAAAAQLAASGLDASAPPPT
jgi:AAA ATPase domain